jgi:hypothetical protein
MLRTRCVCRIQEKDRIRSSDDVGDDEDEGGDQELKPQNGVELSNLWLHAGRFSEGQPRRLDWEVTHVREEVLGARSSAAIVGKIKLGSLTEDFLSNSSNAMKAELRSMQFNFDSIQVCSGLNVKHFLLHSSVVFANIGSLSVFRVRSGFAWGAC